MDTVDPLRFILASMFVLGLLGAFAMVLKYYREHPSALSKKLFGNQSFVAPSAPPRIRVIETQHIDYKRKLVLVKRDNVEHLLLIADGRETVIESGIIHHA